MRGHGFPLTRGRPPVGRWLAPLIVLIVVLWLAAWKLFDIGVWIAQWIVA